MAYVLPWVELFLGAFLFLGLWLPLVLEGLWFLVVIFIIVVVQAIIRNLPITECGCFGQLFSIPLHIVFIIDSSILVIVLTLIRHIKPASFLSLDQYFEKNL